MRAFVVALVSAVIIGEMLLRAQPHRPMLLQTDAVWDRTLRSVQNAPQRLDVVFYGTSRTWLGIDPAAVDDELGRRGRTARSWNLGLNGAGSSTGLLAHLAEPVEADLVVLEQFVLGFSEPVRPEEALARYQAARRRRWAYPVEAGLPWRIAQRLLMGRDGIYLTWHEPWYVSFETHANGWGEARYQLASRRLARERQRRIAGTVVPPIPEAPARAAQADYRRLFDRVLEAGTALVIVRMPVDGPLRELEDAQLMQPHHTDFLRSDPRLLYVDATRHPALRGFRTADDSHLDASVAQAFSRALAALIDAWLSRAPASP